MKKHYLLRNFPLCWFKQPVHRASGNTADSVSSLSGLVLWMNRGRAHTNSGQTYGKYMEHCRTSWRGCSVHSRILTDWDARVDFHWRNRVRPSGRWCRCWQMLPRCLTPDAISLFSNLSVSALALCPVKTVNHMTICGEWLLTAVSFLKAACGSM